MKTLPGSLFIQFASLENRIYASLLFPWNPTWHLTSVNVH